MMERQRYNDYDRADEFRPGGRSYTGTTTRTGLPPVPLARVSEDPRTSGYTGGGYTRPGTLAPYGERKVTATRRPAYQQRRRPVEREGGVMDRVLGGFGFKNRLGAGILLLLIIGLILYTFVTVMFQGFSFIRDGATFGFFNNGARVVQVESYVGHNEGASTPTKFLGMNINRQVTVIEFPGGDPNKTRVIVGPYLYGQGEDKAQVNLNLRDVNGDSKPDLIVTVKGEDTVFLNDGATFRPLTAEERAKLAAGVSK